MQFHFRLLQRYDVGRIATWRYESPYDRNNLTALDLWPYVLLRVLYELMGYECFVVEDDQRFLVGYFIFRRHIHHTIEVGLAMRPDLTGRGYGLAFVEAGLAFCKQRYAAKHFLLFVADFDERAMKVYTRAGFQMGKPVTKLIARGLLDIYPALYYEMQRDA